MGSTSSPSTILLYGQIGEVRRGAQKLAQRAKASRPAWLRPAIRQLLAQLYREDEVRTEVSLVNFLTFYLPNEGLKIIYRPV